MRRYALVSINSRSRRRRSLTEPNPETWGCEKASSLTTCRSCYHRLTARTHRHSRCDPIRDYSNPRNCSSESPECRRMPCSVPRFRSPLWIGTIVWRLVVGWNIRRWLPRCRRSSKPAFLSAATTCRADTAGSLLMQPPAAGWTSRPFPAAVWDALWGLGVLPQSSPPSRAVSLPAHWSKLARKFPPG